MAAAARGHRADRASLASADLVVAATTAGRARARKAARRVAKAAPRAAKLAPRTAKLAPRTGRVAPRTGRVAPRAARVAPRPRTPPGGEASHAAAWYPPQRSRCGRRLSDPP